MRTAARALAWAGVAAGLVLGAAGQAPTPRAPVRHGSYTVVVGDFHVHSFPGDGSLAPWDLAREAQRRGLDVIALTNHNTMLSWRVSRLLPWLAGGAMLIPGQELTAPDYHIAAVGVNAVVPWNQPAADAAAQIRSAGGVPIAAHPAGRYAAAFDTAALDALDGFEAAHPLVHVSERRRRELAAFAARARARRPSLAAIGSSDFHYFAPLGVCRTYLFTTGRSAAAVLDAIRGGRTVACDGGGRTYGPPELAGLVAEDCRRAAGAPPVQPSAIERAGAVCLWLGLTALVLLGAEAA